MPLPAPKLVVFTDLDGTLLDHETYSFKAAQPALDRLKRHEIPVVLTTSKTHSEVRGLQNELALEDPCICENGSALYWGKAAWTKELTDQKQKTFGLSYDDICLFIRQLPERMRKDFYGFSDMTVENVMKNTGLPEDKAVCAKQRLASEPFLWRGNETELAALKERALAAGLSLLQGGRFYHLLAPVDKADACAWLMAHMRGKYPQDKIISCALGDGPNDMKMIAGADLGIVIANPKGSALELNGDSIRHSQQSGPTGWNREINRLLDELGLF